MDVYKIEPPARQKTAPAEDTQRPPLVPSEKNNATAIPAVRKSRTREVSSRYKSGVSSAPVSTPSSPRRCQSPTASRSPAPGISQPKRAQSAERKRPTTPSSRVSAPSSPRPSTPSSPSSRSTTPARDAVTETHNSARRSLSNRAPDGLWPSMRSLSSSFQSESISVPVSRREKVVPNPSSVETTKATSNAASERKRTPLRGRNTSDQSENFRPTENPNARVIDQHRWPAMLGGRTNALSRSVDVTDKVNRSASSVTMPRGLSPKKIGPVDSAKIAVQQSLSESARKSATDGSGRVERDLKSSRDNSSQASERSSSVTRPSRTQSLTNQGLRRPSSPSRALSTPSTTFRGLLSPSRTRPSTPMSSPSSSISRAGSTSSVLNYIVDVRKGKKNANHIEDAHQLRLLYNANLQWRFANARAEDTLSIQKMRTESVLYSVADGITKLRDSVNMKKIEVQHMRQEIKLDLVMKEQMTYLEQWVAVERDHYSSLVGAVEALKASTLRLPVTGGARADIFALKNAVSSAVDVMQAMGSSICYLLSKVEDVKMLVTEVSAVAEKEKAMLDECRESLASAAAMQVQESSLRSHLIQLKQDAFKLE